MPPRRRKRLDPAWFNLSVDRFRQGGSIDLSAARVREILLAENRAPKVTVQISAERACIMGGTDEAIALLKLCAGDAWGELSVSSLSDGDHADAGETVMIVTGSYPIFAHLEPMLLGTLARRTCVTTNARTFAEVARPKLVLAFPARHDHWLVEPGDALAAQIGGARPISADPAIPTTAARAPSPAVVTALALLPHALIAVYGGDTVAAARAFVAYLGPDSQDQVIVPVDYDNNAIQTALEVARAIDVRLWGVQLATSENLVNASLLATMGAYPPTGVNPQLVWNVRNALDAEGFGDTKILVSSGVTVDRIRQFEEEGIPVDAYGIGAALLVGRTGFHSALVEMDASAAFHVRAGNERRANSRLERVK